ncbi:YidH family protein [Dethiothermospora halolimnae]|uniref:YidH family protein n=1 Tax=Dethiothermospora halolimnae TaxID=3114390 RepID=UPI003CCB8E9D
MGKKKNVLAEERTDLAHERTFLANERTFIAWLRTGLALVGAGLGIVKFLESEGPDWVMRIMGLLLVITGEASYIFAYWRYNRIRKKLDYEALDTVPIWLLIFITISVLVMSVVSGLVIFNW